MICHELIHPTTQTNGQEVVDDQDLDLSKIIEVIFLADQYRCTILIEFEFARVSFAFKTPI
jgi:hypothetical protein